MHFTLQLPHSAPTQLEVGYSKALFGQLGIQKWYHIQVVGFHCNALGNGHKSLLLSYYTENLKKSWISRILFRNCYDLHRNDWSLIFMNSLTLKISSHIGKSCKADKISWCMIVECISNMKDAFCKAWFQWKITSDKNNIQCSMLNPYFSSARRYFSRSNKRQHSFFLFSLGPVWMFEMTGE